MAKALDALIGNSSALILIPEKDAYEGVIRSTNNLPDAKIVLSNYINVRDLIQYDKVIMPLSTVEKITEHLG
jgi:large subunit ribosomal protein L4